MIAMLNHPRFAEFDFSALRQVGSGGSPVPVSLMDQMKARINAGHAQGRHRAGQGRRVGIGAEVLDLRAHARPRIRSTTIPMGAETGFSGVVDLIAMKALVTTDGKVSETEIPSDLMETIRSSSVPGFFSA